MSVLMIRAGKRGAVLHVNRQFIAMNAKDGGDRPVYTLKPDGPNSKALYAKKIEWDGPTTAVHDGHQLSCGARAWIELSPGTPITLYDPKTFTQAKEEKCLTP